jgi:site-specific DNA-methyltransferase (adenine-specific)
VSGKAEPELRPNTLYCGDCLPVLQAQIPDRSIDLVYMDPPFGSGADYEVVFNDGVEIRHFKDRWIGRKQGYLKWIEPRIRECHRVLKDTGSFWLHCDDHLNGYLRVLLDDIFGERNFRNEVIWKRTSAHGDAKRFGSVHDTLFLYSKSDEWKWNPQYEPHKPAYLRQFYRHREGPNGEVVTMDWDKPLPDGWRVFRIDNLSSPHPRPNLTYTYKGYAPPAYGWRMTKAKMEALDAAGKLWFPKDPGGRIGLRRYLDPEGEGQKIQDVWVDINPVGSGARTRQSFPTQKPPKLLQRVIQANSNPGDIVLDPVCGCGTTILAAQELGRKWVGIDISPTACRLIAKRVGVPTNSIVGLPRTIREIKEMVKLDPIEFQNWVCDILHAVSTTRRGDKPRADANIDGWILSTVPVQIKGSEAIGYGEIERFAESLRKRGKQEGLFVAFSFSKPAFEEAVRIQREEKVSIDLLEVTEKVTPANGGNPEVTTYLHSELTKRTWGERAEAGPAAPPQLMIQVKPAKKGRTKRLSEVIPAAPAAPPSEKGATPG